MESDTDSYFEESSKTEEEVAGPIYINVNLEESPEPPPPASPSPYPPAPISVGDLSPVWELPDDGTNFLSYFKRADVLESKKRAKETRARMSEERYVVEAPMVSQGLWAFLQHFHGQQWEVKFLQPAARPLFDQMLAYIVGYARLTRFNENILRRYFGGCSAAGKSERLRLLAESGGFLKIE